MSRNAEISPLKKAQSNANSRKSSATPNRSAQPHGFAPGELRSSLLDVEAHRSRLGKPHAKPNAKPDQRTLRTCDRLGSALLNLLLERPMHAVTVQAVLDRASVGRSTFYLHYRDKDDLLLSQLEGFLEIMSTLLIVRREDSPRVLPVEEMFAHIKDGRKLYQALADGQRLNEFYDLAQGYFSRGIEQRLLDSRRVPRLTPTELAARSAGLAGSLLSLLRWWLDHGARESPTEMDQLFHSMVWQGLRQLRTNTRSQAQRLPL